MVSRKKVERMDKPLDTLAKRQSAYIGDVIHEYYQFPGKYDGPCQNEYPDALGSIPRIDAGYFLRIDNKRYIMNIEDESKIITEETLLKSDRYKLLLEYAFKIPVISAITTIAPIEKCKTVLHKSPTQALKPFIRSYPTSKAEKILSSITDKIEHGDTLSKVEALELIMLPKRFMHNHTEVLEKVCNLLKILKVDDKYFKYELILEMKCIIHKYAVTLNDIEHFEEVIGLTGVKTAMEYQKEALIKQGKKQGYEQGIKEKFELALKIKNTFGINKALELSKFTYNELNTEIINKNRFELESK